MEGEASPGETSEDGATAEGKGLIKAASLGDVEECRRVLDRNVVAASFQDSTSGKSALMAAAGAGCVEGVRLLLERGAPWNALDREAKCAGEYAMASGSQACVDALVNAGVQAQLLFGALEDTTTSDDRTTDGYLAGDVALDSETLVDANGDAVMMEWERPLMEASADVLSGKFPHEWCAILRAKSDLSVLNVGHGMGIIDGCLRERRPRRHTIVEAHPTVIDSMRAGGWFDRALVRAERWQSAVADPTFGPFDSVYYDTYAETYNDMRDFFRTLPRLLAKPHGIFSFFNGCCPFNPFFHGVACELISLELAAIGLELDFVPIKVEPLNAATWQGIRRRYWVFDSYYLPIARWKNLQ